MRITPAVKSEEEEPNKTSSLRAECSLEKRESLYVGESTDILQDIRERRVSLKNVPHCITWEVLIQKFEEIFGQGTVAFATVGKRRGLGIVEFNSVKRMYRILFI